MSKVKCLAYSNCSVNIIFLLCYTGKKKKKDGENEEIGGGEMISKDIHMGIKEGVLEFMERQISILMVCSWAGLLSTQKWATSV